VATFPEDDQLETARTELAACYYYERQLEACFELLEVNLRLYPDSPWVDYWRFLIGQIHFRRWRYEEAKESLTQFLADYPDSKYADQARAYLGRIDPPLQVDRDGIVGYAGKYEGDIRLQAAMEALPGYKSEGLRTLHKRLGVDLAPHARVLYAFKDGGPKVSGGLNATTRIIGIDNKPTVIIYLYAERVVTDHEGFRRTVIHEMKHAGFLGIMGDAYHDLPKWIREGLALWGTEDVDSRVQLVLCNRITGGKDPMDVLDGVEDPEHTNRDYLEDVLAFEWLASKSPDNISAFCRRLTEGEPYRKIWSDLSGAPYDVAMREANAYCRRRVEQALGDGYETFAAFRKEGDAAMKKGAAATREWLKSGGHAGFKQWLSRRAGHPAEPMGRMSLARALIIAGEHAAGRELLREILEKDAGRSTLMDDAQFWIGVSYNHQRDHADAARAFGAFLRDYPSSQYVRQLAGKFPVAGPVSRRVDHRSGITVE